MVDKLFWFAPNFLLVMTHESCSHLVAPIKSNQTSIIWLLGMQVLSPPSQLLMRHFLVNNLGLGFKYNNNNNFLNIIIFKIV